MRGSGQMKGIVCLLISGAILSFTDGLSKYLTEQFPPGEILFFRAFFIFIPISFMVWRSGGLASLRIVKDFVATPTYGPALAARSIDALEKKIPYGLYHLAGGDEISWYEYALKIAEAAGREADISPATDREYPTIAKRPRYSALSNAKLVSEGIAPMPPLDDCLADYVLLRKRERPRRS